MGRKATATYRVFSSHGWTDKWVAEQIAARIQAAGAETFLDVFDIEKGDDFEERIFGEMPSCKELVALLTPWSVDRNWVWVEIGAARAFGLCVVVVVYGLTLSDLENDRGGKVFLGAKNIAEINDLNAYLAQISKRVAK